MSELHLETLTLRQNRILILERTLEWGNKSGVCYAEDTRELNLAQGKHQGRMLVNFVCRLGEPEYAAWALLHLAPLARVAAQTRCSRKATLYTKFYSETGGFVRF